MKTLMLAGAMAATAACAPVPMENDIPEKGASGARCDATAARALVGQPATRELGAEALRLTGAAMLRWINPGDVVTMDYRSDRLNIHLDARGRVERLACG